MFYIYIYINVRHCRQLYLKTPESKRFHYGLADIKKSPFYISGVKFLHVISTTKVYTCSKNYKSIYTYMEYQMDKRRIQRDDRHEKLKREIWEANEASSLCPVFLERQFSQSHRSNWSVMRKLGIPFLMTCYKRSTSTCATILRTVEDTANRCREPGTLHVVVWSMRNKLQESDRYTSMSVM